MPSADPFSAQAALKTSEGDVRIWRLSVLSRLGRLERLPFSIRILLENLLRNVDGFSVTGQDVENLVSWNAKAPAKIELPFKPARVILQDFTGVPCLVDLAAMRSGIARAGGDPQKIERINPLVPCDLVIDHSVQVDAYGTPGALTANIEMEFRRNRERYEFLKWGSKAFRNFRVVPPGTGIVHQVNLEYLASVVMTQKVGGQTLAFPDTLVGTDSHTTMINGLGVVGWGVGGIEAEAAMLGQPVPLLMPEVVGFKLKGRLREGATATDLVLTVTQILRAKGVVGKFVEFYGDGLDAMSLPDRATVANMAPEYGATLGFFPVDQETLNYMKFTGRSAQRVDLVERYTKEQGLFRTPSTPDPEFSDRLELDLSTVEPCLAGPKRPQDRVALSASRSSFRKALVAILEGKLPRMDPHRISAWIAEGGESAGDTPKLNGNGTTVAVAPPDDLEALTRKIPVQTQAGAGEIGHGSVVIAAITSCTNTSNPSVMLGAGLLAKKAVERGLSVKPSVKTSLAPGSGVVTAYLERAGLTPYLEKLGFHTVGYGCCVCIGNAGPLAEPINQAIQENHLVVASVLSGNRNFEGRIHPMVRANYLASPPLVVAYALAGTVDIDLTRDPIGQDKEGKPVYLKEIWPTSKEVADTVRQAVTARMFQERYGHVLEGSAQWREIRAGTSTLYPWDPKSTYIQEPPFFIDMPKIPKPIAPIRQARVLVMVGDSVTTDHISPAGAIAKDSPAGRYLIEQGVQAGGFNSYGARRGNDRVMTRGTFANARLKNQMAPGTEGWWTTHLPAGEKMSIYDAALKYQKEGTPLLVLAGKEYGAGSSRDWAAKGTALLGVKAVLAESFERIHRSNLIGMGVLPLQLEPGETCASAGLTGHEIFDIPLSDELKAGQKIILDWKRPENEGAQSGRLAVNLRIDTPLELEYFRNGGVLQAVLRKILEGR
ncbi:MAG: aconitate hydratase [Candidatus Omnitrophica bacterium]|nr:aconitate hydratase [Candidatus Omnitrophota bacterium]